MRISSFVWSLLCLSLVLVSRVESMSSEEQLELKNTVKEMIDHAFDSYVKFAYGKDVLLPLSCEGKDTFGGYSLTLIDSLDTLALIGDQQKFEDSVKYVIENVSFDIESLVSVFETNIRVVGGLLSAHFLASTPPTKIVSYKGELLSLAEECVKRLLPAFETPTGIPFGMVHLREGVLKNESKISSTAGGSTYLLEFGVISRIVGNATYEKVAKRAMQSLFNLRTSRGLVGNHVNVLNGQWTHRDSGIGASVDSFFEYMLKGYLLFGDADALDMFHKSYRAIERHIRRGPWYFDVNMNSGAISWASYNSLQGFWPGLLSLAGDVRINFPPFIRYSYSLLKIYKAKRAQRAFHGIWRLFGCVPEGFSLYGGNVLPSQRGYPLRPELMESAYYLYRATKDPVYLYMGRDYVRSLNALARTDCGFALIRNVETGTLENKMESFLLSETLKYLYLLFDEDNFIHREIVVFNTEGHPLPALPQFLIEERNISMKDATCEILPKRETLFTCET